MTASTTWSAQLRVSVHPDRRRVVVAADGELDLATVEPVEHEVAELCERGFAEVCLDLRGLTFFDSGGVRLLLRLDRHLAARGCRFTVEAGDGAAARVLRLVRLDERFGAARG
jgi:anti-anti-sigma factor